MTPFVIRATRFEDAEEITRVHIQSWQESYRGLMPQAYLDGISFEERLSWRLKGWERIQRGESGCFVATVHDRIVGFTAFGLSRSPELSIPGEIGAIYVLNVHQGSGIGGELFRAARNWLDAKRLLPFHVWVLKDNVKARSLYQHVKGREIPQTKSVNFGGVPQIEVSYVWES